MAAAPKFAKTNEWIRLDDDGLATVGISAYAVEALTDLVFMQLPAVGRTVKAGESIGEIESVKAVSDFYAPVSGEVVEVNGFVDWVFVGGGTAGRPGPRACPWEPGVITRGRAPRAGAAHSAGKREEGGGDRGPPAI